MNGNSALIKTPKSSLALLPFEDTTERQPFMNQESSHQTPNLLELCNLRTEINVFAYKPPRL